MRRVFIFTALLLLLGLSTAFAASFSTQSEDIASFTTDVSISVPTTQPPPTPFPGTLYVRNGSNAPIGSLDLAPPPKNDSVTNRQLLLSTETIETQATATKYITWKSPAAPANGYLLSGSVTLYFEQNEGGTNRMTAGLFLCPAAALASTTTTALTSPCTVIATGVSPSLSGGGQGYEERTVSFGTIPPTTIPSGQELRLKLVNRSVGGLSTEDVGIQWGFLPARQSRLVIS